MRQVGWSFQRSMTRVSLILVVLVSFGLIVILRLIEIQLVRGADFLNLANQNRYFQLQLPPERGVIFDRYQQPLAYNQRVYYQVDDSTLLYPQQTLISKPTALRLLATQSAQVRFGLKRAYHFSKALAHVLGYVGRVTAQDLLADRSLNADDVVGKTGLEQVFNTQLRGQAGHEVYEINAQAKRQRLISHNAGTPGQNLWTSLDPYLSQVAFQALSPQQGAVVILDAKSGQVLSLVNSPSFELNIFGASLADPRLEKQRQGELRALFTDPLQIFFNRSVSGAYPPGSVFKLITALGGLEGQAVDATTTVLDEGVLRVGQFEYTNWYYNQFGRTEGEISLRRAIARSNDIYFYKVAQWLGPERLAEFARLFGLGQTTGIELPAEASGLVPDPAWKERVIGEPWYLGNTFHLGIGQGDVLVTPLQVAQMTQAVGNEGTLCQPSLLKKASPDCRELGVSSEHLELVLEGMLDACSPGGTAYPFFSYNEKRRDEELSANLQLKTGAIACKTGTAEFGEQDERGYRKTHGWLTAVVGTAQIQDLAKKVAAGMQEVADEQQKKWLELVAAQGLPNELVITVLVESDEAQPYKEGSRDAAPVVKQLVDWMSGQKLAPSE